MTTANQPAAPRIVNVEYTPGQTYNTIKMTTAPFAIVTWDNGSKTVLYDDAARSTYNAWNERRTVHVVQRSSDGWNISIVEVTLRWACPICGGPRGEPTFRNFCEDGEWYGADMWQNPCGHLDKYSDVLKEASK